jgi:hypothetical protein
MKANACEMWCVTRAGHTQSLAESCGTILRREARFASALSRYGVAAAALAAACTGL